ncbi:MAG: phage antirepressor [Clostridia bacterium]|nr:phage antirepressor [Clostridia bacterium]
MNELQIFKNEEFGEVRTVEENGKILFCGSDVAKALGYTIPHKAVREHCKKDGVLNQTVIDSMGRKQQAKFVTEGNLYRLITHSKLPSAEKFERWVFDEVLPSIRKHDGYLTPKKIEEILLNPDTLMKLAQNLKEEQEKNKALTADVERMKPKEIFADAVTTSNDCILIGELAKLLKQNGVNIGQNRLFEWLRKNKYLISRKGDDYNTPTQRAMEMNLFRVKETTIAHSDGRTTVKKTTKVTGKGQLYFINKFKEMFVA